MGQAQDRACKGPGMSKLLIRLVAIVVVLVAPMIGAKPIQANEGCLPSVLKTRLAQIRKTFGKINVVSTHRPGARIRGSGKPSYHGSCRAVDFVPPSGKYNKVVRWLYANHEGGVGTYTCMSHIHIDNGPYVRWSKCR